MGKYETANLLAILAAGRKPQWVTQPDYTGAPVGGAAGNYLESAIQTLVVVQLRGEVEHRRARVTVTSLDLTAVYTVVVDGHAAAYDAGASGATTLQDVLDGIAAALVLAPAIAALVTVSVDDADGDGTDDTVNLVGKAEADYLIDFLTTGAAVLSVDADASTASMRFWATLGSANAPAGWVLPYDADYPFGYRGFMERFETAGLDRAYSELYDVTCAGDGADVTYSVAISYGPCVTE